MVRKTWMMLLCTAAVLAGCKDDPTTTVDAGLTHDTGSADRPAEVAGEVASADGGEPAASAERGKYLVQSVLNCGGCHTSREMGAPVLGGVKCFRDTMTTVAGKGCINSANLTNHETGLKNRTNAQIKDVLRTGLRPDGKYLFSHMPTYLFANLTDVDADSIVAYLRTVPAADNMLPANEDPWTDDKRPAAQSPQPVKLSEPSAIPTVPAGAANAESAGRGRYLAALTCIECHTKAPTDPAVDRAFDVALAYQGGKSFTGTMGMVYSFNLTPDDTGIKSFSAADIVKVLKQNRDPMGKGVCSPMRSWPNMTDGDATDIAHYLLALPPKVNMLPMQCAVENSDAGSDASDGGDAGDGGGDAPGGG
jgi:mono/diheme cytochrome c family protein